MGLAGIEIRYLARRLSERAAGCYVANVYGVSADCLLFRLRHPDREGPLLAVSTSGMWESSFRVAQAGGNRMTRRLRQDLLRLRVESIEQPGAERAARIRFAGRGAGFVLVAEFFGGGNVVLCDSSMRILAVLRQLDVRHRKLRTGIEYEPPPANAPDPFGATAASLGAARAAGLRADRWLGRAAGLPSRYAEHVLRAAGADPRADSAGLGDAAVAAVAASLADVAGRVAGGDHDPAIVRGPAGPEAHPVDLGGRGGGASEPAPSFMAALDRLLTEGIAAAGREELSREDGARMRALESRIAEQGRAAGEVAERARGISGLAGSLASLAAAGAASLADPRAAAALAAAGAEAVSVRGAPAVRVAGQTVGTSGCASLHAVASRLFDESKRQAAAAPEIARLRRRAEAELARLRGDSERRQAAVTTSEVRRRAWYERYRWFFTSDGSLAIGGRDSSSNSAIIRKHMEAGDRVFHADIHGSPFFVLKGGGAGDASVAEAAHATVCFSRAWRGEVHGLGAYWVRPEQVGRAAPSGQYLPRGSFTMSGRRSPVRVPTLRLAVGLAGAPGSAALSCGPPQAIAASCAAYAVIEPGGLDAAECAKRARAALLAHDERLAAGVPLDEFVRALPAGRSHVAGPARRGAAQAPPGAAPPPG